MFSTLVKAQLRAEFRDKTLLLRSFPFVGLILLLFAFAFDPDRGVLKAISPGLWWVVASFAAMFIFTRDSHNKRETNFINQFGLDPQLTFFARVIVNFILTFLVTFVSGLVVVFLFSPDVINIGLIVVISILGTLSLSVIGSIYSPIVRNNSDAGQFLTLIVLPTALPALLAAIQATDAALNSDLSESYKWVGLMAIFTVLYLSAGALACDSLES